MLKCGWSSETSWFCYSDCIWSLDASETRCRLTYRRITVVNRHWRFLWRRYDVVYRRLRWAMVPSRPTSTQMNVDKLDTDEQTRHDYNSTQHFSQWRHRTAPAASASAAALLPTTAIIIQSVVSTSHYGFNRHKTKTINKHNKVINNRNCV